MSMLFFQAFRAVEDAIYDNFAGPNDVGLFSASVQQTVYDTQVWSGSKIMNYDFEILIVWFLGASPSCYPTNGRNLYGLSQQTLF